MRRLFPLIPLMLLMCTGTATAMTLKIATLSPEGTSWMKLMRAAGEHIAAETDGRVKLRFYPGGVMGDYKAVLRKIRIGQLHGGAVTSGALAAVDPDAVIYSLPFLFRDLAEVDHLRARTDQHIIDRLAGKGMISFGFAGGGFTHLMSTREIRNLEQVQTRKVWTPVGDRVSQEAFGSLRISPITLPLTDVLTGLQTGLVDTVAAPPVGAIALQWHTQVRYLLDMPLTYIYGALVISERVMRRLSDADQKVLTRVLIETFAEMDRQNREDNIQAKAALRNQGIQFIEPTVADRDRLEQTVHGAIRKLDQEGYFSPGLVQEIRKRVLDFRAARPTAGP